MRHTFYAITLLACVASSYVAAEGIHSPAPHERFNLPKMPGSKQSLKIHNRVLGKANGKPISVRDVSKQLDLVFTRQFPDNTDEEELRYQFFVTNWKPIYDELVNKELILAEVEEKKVPISHGDVREEMERLFGPDILENLEKAKMSYDEAWEMIKTDISIRRMLMVRVNQKALNAVGPTMVREAYGEWLANQKTGKQWNYRVVTVQGDDELAAADIAAQAYERLSRGSSTADTLGKDLAEVDEGSGCRVSVTESLERDERTISDSHKQGLAGISVGEVGTPVQQVLRGSDAKVFRLFLLSDEKEIEVPTFQAVGPQLHNFLVQKEVERETLNYIAALRKQYDVENLFDTEGYTTSLFSLE